MLLLRLQSDAVAIQFTSTGLAPDRCRRLHCDNRRHESWYIHFDIVLGHFLTVSQLGGTPQTPCGALYARLFLRGVFLVIEGMRMHMRIFCMLPLGMLRANWRLRSDVMTNTHLQVLESVLTRAPDGGAGLDEALAQSFNFWTWA